jgi:hypothetical protein
MMHRGVHGFPCVFLCYASLPKFWDSIAHRFPYLSSYFLRGRFPQKQVRIFKGGGYIMADLISMIQSAGMSHVLSVTQRIHEADCVVVKERWGSGRHVNLKQVHAAVAISM